MTGGPTDLGATIGISLSEAVTLGVENDSPSVGMTDERRMSERHFLPIKNKNQWTGGTKEHTQTWTNYESSQNVL